MQTGKRRRRVEAGKEFLGEIRRECVLGTVWKGSKPLHIGPVSRGMLRFRQDQCSDGEFQEVQHQLQTPKGWGWLKRPGGGLGQGWSVLH